MVNSPLTPCPRSGTGHGSDPRQPRPKPQSTPKPAAPLIHEDSRPFTRIGDTTSHPCPRSGTGHGSEPQNPGPGNADFPLGIPDPA